MRARRSIIIWIELVSYHASTSHHQLPLHSPVIDLLAEPLFFPYLYWLVHKSKTSMIFNWSGKSRSAIFIIPNPWFPSSFGISKHHFWRTGTHQHAQRMFLVKAQKPCVLGNRIKSRELMHLRTVRHDYQSQLRWPAPNVEPSACAETF